MTDEEIIQALEYCAFHDVTCRDCPYAGKFGSKFCDSLLHIDALGLIERQQLQIERLNKTGEIHKCANEEISIKPDGVHELSPHKFDLKEKLKNVTVEILECEECGEISIGWYRKENTEVCDE